MPDATDETEQVNTEQANQATEVDEGDKGEKGEKKPSPESKGQKFSTDSPTMSEIIRRKKPNIRTCFILLDSALGHEIQELQGEIEKLEKRIKYSSAKSTLADPNIRRLDQLREELEAKEEEADEFLVEFKFQDIGRKAYDELVRDNRPSDEEKKEYKDAGGEGILQYSYADFPPKLVAASCVEPKITEGEAHQIFDEWSEGDLELLFTTALLACKEPTSLPKSRAGTAKIPDSEQNSTTALNSDSPTQSS